MQLELIQDLNAFQKLEKDWNDLLSKSASHVPFLRHEYLSCWWQTLGGGEWERAELFILTARDQNQLQGIAPLFIHEKTLLFIGSYEISDYLDLIVPPHLSDAFIGNLFNYLQEHSSEWETLDLYNLRKNSPSLPRIREAAFARDWTYEDEVIQPAPCLSLPGSWEEYLQGLDSKNQHEIERKLRRAEGYFLPLNWYIVEEEDQLDREMDDFLKLMAYHPEKADFLTDIMKSQLRKTVHVAFQEGWIQLAFLTVGGKKAAGYLNFDYDNRLWIYNSGLNPIFENISPGWVLLSYLIRWAISKGRVSLDFMRGDEGYKYRFGGVDQYVVRAQIERDST
ncbi:MAG: GNAT family N-acetyltransferase [Anaerolineales bacterium]|nr:GNAT family N-acetyltransferase [Anaerolineales bacterium]